MAPIVKQAWASPDCHKGARLNQLDHAIPATYNRLMGATNPDDRRYYETQLTAMLATLQRIAPTHPHLQKYLHSTEKE